MGKGAFRSAGTFVKNLVGHGQRIVARKETVREALGRVKDDSTKLGHALSRGDARKPERARAQAMVKRGRERYNAKDYPAAEECFRGALTEDPKCVWAATYLGHTLYQMGRLSEATNAWRRAYAMDPASDAGLRAQRKLQHVEKHQADVISDLRDRTGLK